MQLHLIEVLHVTRAFVRKLRPKEMVKPECIYDRLDEEWEVRER